MSSSAPVLGSAGAMEAAWKTRRERQPWPPAGVGGSGTTSQGTVGTPARGAGGERGALTALTRHLAFPDFLEFPFSGASNWI